MKMPGLLGNEFQIKKNINSGTTNGSATDMNVTAHGYVAGDGLSIGYYYVEDAGSQLLFYRRDIYRTVDSVIDSNVFKCGLITEPNTVNYLAVFNRGTQREKRTEPVTSRIQFDYYLPGVTPGIASASDIPILQPAKILDGSGNEVGSYGESTSPNQADYLSATVGTEVVIQESVLRRWRGPIYERQTRYAEAR
jgi:hypothetical protein